MTFWCILNDFQRILYYFSSCLQVLLPWRDVTSGSSSQPGAEIQSTLWGKNRQRSWGGEGGGLEEATQTSFLCKIASSLISNCLFTGNEFPNRLKFSLCWYVTASSLPKLFKLLRVDVRKHRLSFKTKQNTKKTLRVIIQLQDTCWTNTTERRPLKSN